MLRRWRLVPRPDNFDILNINFIQTHGNSSQEEIHDFFNMCTARRTPTPYPTNQ